MKYKWRSILFLFLSLLVTSLVSCVRENSKSPYRIIIDGGSTGSRLHIFEFVHDSFTNHTNCIRRGSEKVQIPLSAYAPSLSYSQQDLQQKVKEEVKEEVKEVQQQQHDATNTLFSPLNSTHVAQHLIPLFDYAAQIVPSKYHSTTHVLLQATAGMRLLPEQEQELVYDAIYNGLKEHPNFVFTHLKRSDIGVLPGSVEALYGAVAANFLKGVVDVHLHMLNPNHYHDDDNNDGNNVTVTGTATNTNTATSNTVHDNDNNYWNVQMEQDNDFDGPLGALDMGGASMQIVYLPNTDTNPECHNEHHDTCNTNDHSSMDPLPDISHPNRLNSDEFFSVSYLSYGADQFRERLYDTFVNERDRLKANGALHSTSNTILNPCSFQGYTFHWKGFEFVGTGDAKQCAMEVNRLIPHHEETVDFDYYDDYYYDNDEEDFIGGIVMSHHPMTKRRRVGGVHHPPVRGKFFAMSLFFFTLDCLRELSGHEALNSSWPTPSIGELTDALDDLCSRKWQGDLETIQHHSHEFTRAEVLPDRCFEAVYMVTLLRDGFGFEWDSRDITFTYLVDGSEVEWSLGMAISHFAEEESPAVTVSPCHSSSGSSGSNGSSDSGHCTTSSESRLKDLWSYGRNSTPFQYMNTMSTSIRRILGYY
jgi:Golgi nucleoside diphosphatase